MEDGLGKGRIGGGGDPAEGGVGCGGWGRGVKWGDCMNSGFKGT